MKKKETEAQARERRKKQYGCDGLCYGGMNDDGVMCQPSGGIDTGADAVNEKLCRNRRCKKETRRNLYDG